MDSKKLSNLQKDFLREVGNIAAGNATTAMAKLIDKRIKMEVPSVNIITINELMDIIGGPEKVVVTIFFRIEGELPGTVYFVLSLEEAEYLVRKTTMNDELILLDNGEPNELAISVLQETANILTGAYLSAISDFTKIKMATTVPYLSIDMAAATLVTGLVELSNVTDYAITIETTRSEEHTSELQSR